MPSGTAGVGVDAVDPERDGSCPSSRTVQGV